MSVINGVGRVLSSIGDRLQAGGGKPKAKAWQAPGNANPPPEQISISEAMAQAFRDPRWRDVLDRMGEPPPLPGTEDFGRYWARQGGSQGKEGGPPPASEFADVMDDANRRIREAVVAQMYAQATQLGFQAFVATRQAAALVDIMKQTSGDSPFFGAGVGSPDADQHEETQTKKASGGKPPVTPGTSNTPEESHGPEDRAGVMDDANRRIASIIVPGVAFQAGYEAGYKAGKSGPD